MCTYLYYSCTRIQLIIPESRTGVAVKCVLLHVHTSREIDSSSSSKYTFDIQRYSRLAIWMDEMTMLMSSQPAAFVGECSLVGQMEIVWAGLFGISLTLYDGLSLAYF